jgi:uncharacterized membrane protein YedE/YeeE
MSIEEHGKLNGMETEFTPLLSLSGGVLIGLSATLLMAMHGRIAGMTGILNGVIPPLSSDWGWRAAFLIGAIAAPAVFLLAGGTIHFAVPVSTTALVIGGLIVGIGVTFGSGCTSGHGVCGMARLSPRSIVATLVFMATTFATVFVVRHILGGI